MGRLKGIIVPLIFFLLFFSTCHWAWAEDDKVKHPTLKKEAERHAQEYIKELKTNQVHLKEEAKKVAGEYIKDLRKKIAEERYETIPKLGERFSLRQSGSIRNESAYRIRYPREFTKIKNQFILSETGRFTDNLRFKVSGRAYYDAVFDLTDNYGKNVASDQELEVELRDTYLDYSQGPWDLRLGKQQIVWGEAVALFFADSVNAKDLREYILPDFDLIRIPEWGTDLEYSRGKFHAELVWLPFPEFDKLAVTSGEFVFPYPLPTTDTAYTTQDPQKPENTLEHSEAGLRLSYRLSGWDFSTFYLHSWTKSPVSFRAISAGVYNFTPDYKRLDIFGATFAKEINDIVFKGEFVLNQDDYFPIYDATDSDGIVQRSCLNYLLGADYTFFDKFEANLQFMQKFIFDYHDLLINEDELDNSLAFRIKTDFLNGKLEPEFLLVSSLKEMDILYRPKVIFNLNDNWRLRFGADIFQGEAAGIFGKFEKKSRLYCETIYNF